MRIILTLKQYKSYIIINRLTENRSRDVRNVAEDHIVLAAGDPKSDESRSQIDMSIRI